MASFYARNGAGDLLARYSFIEPLLGGKRVLEVGAARATGGGSALFLAERGAAAVLSLEPVEDDLAAAREAGHHPFVQFRAGAPEALRPGTFDLALVADGAALARSPETIAALRRLLAAGGRLVTAIPAGGAGLAEVAGEAVAADVPPYEGFVGALSDHFALVEVATQSATVGWVLALAADGEEPEVAMDGTLAGTPEAAAYVAICGDEPCGIAGVQVTVLPVKPLVDAVMQGRGTREASEEATRRFDALQAERDDALAQLVARAEALTQAVAERDEVVRARDEARAERDQALQGRETARAERDEAVSSREAALAALAEARSAREASLAELEDARAVREAAEQSIARLRSEAALLADRARDLEALLETEREAAFDARAAVDRAQAAEAERARAAEQARAQLQAATEAQARAQAELAERRDGALEAEAALQAARAEAQAGKSAVEAVLARAVTAEGKLAELEEALEARARDDEEERSDAKELRARIAELEGAAERAEHAHAETLAAAGAERDEARARADAAAAERSELERLRAEAAAREEAAREAASVREGLEAQVAELGARLETQEERVRIAEAQAAEARAQVDGAHDAGRRGRGEGPGGDDARREGRGAGGGDRGRAAGGALGEGRRRAAAPRDGGGGPGRLGG
jgi:SAM-dependent methyltransferase